MNKNFYVTTPIYYVNAEPHIGHAYTTILADFMHRFNQMLGQDSFFLTGTDEHGDKIFEAAQVNNTTPEKYTDIISNKFKQTWVDFDIKFSDFIRTTEERHVKIVKDILQKVYDKGDIYFGSYGGHYCVGCERFFTEKEMVDGKCPDHNKKLQFIEEKNYFFKMSKYQDWLVDHINKNPDFIRPERYKNEVLAMLKHDALEDLCISRPKSRLNWGISLPFDDNYVTYVWFDALINYISALEYPKGDKFKKYWPASQHIIGKDIVKAHGIFWPTMLKAAEIEPYQNLNVHGYWNLDGSKISKSLGNVITPKFLIDKYGNDQMRFFFLRSMTFGEDASYNENIIIDRINFDLANDLGNLIKRTFDMVGKFLDGNIPDYSENETASRDELIEKFKKSAEDYINYNSKFQISIGIEKLWEYVRYLNKYIDSNKPWVLAKENKTELLSSVMRNLLESIYGLSVLLSPIFINKSDFIIDALHAADGPRDFDSLFKFDVLSAGTKLKEVGILFPRLDKITDDKKDNSKKQKNEDTEGLIDISEFAKVDIRVAQVLEAEKVEGSDKLLELKVDSGLDERIIIAGIAQSYEPDYLKGKKILLVANLKPAVIFKKKSNGMLLAAKISKKDKPILIEIDDKIPVGSRLG